MPTATSSNSPSSQPAWEIAMLFPDQGNWTEHDYLKLSETSSRLVELVDGRIEVLPVSTRKHQSILGFLFLALHGFVQSRELGEVWFSPLPVRLTTKHYREPDLIYVREGHTEVEEEKYLTQVDLVMEVVSDDDPKRDLVEKRRDYEKYGIGEYWIIDPRDERVTVLRLEDGKYLTHGVFARCDIATSPMIDQFQLEVAAIFDAGKKHP